MTLLFYLTRIVGLRVLAVCVCLITLGIGVDLIRTAPELLEFGGGKAVATYALFRVPAMLATTLPIATLIGGLLAMLSLGQNSELPIMRAAGISTQWILFWLVPLALVLGFIHYLTVDRGIVWSNNALGATFGKIANVDVPEIGRPVAVREENRILYGKLASLDGRSLAPFTSFTLDSNGIVIQRENANTGTYSDGSWVLYRVDRLVVQDKETIQTKLPRYALKSAMTPQLVLDLASKTKAVDSRHAAAVLAKEAIATRGSAYYAMQINRSYVAWVIPFVMLLIGMLGSYKLPRSARGLRAAGVGFVIGIFFIGVDGLFTSFGRLGILSADFAAYTPSFSFSLLAVIALRQLES